MHFEDVPEDVVVVQPAKNRAAAWSTDEACDFWLIVSLIVHVLLGIASKHRRNKRDPVRSHLETLLGARPLQNAITELGSDKIKLRRRIWEHKFAVNVSLIGTSDNFTSFFLGCCFRPQVLRELLRHCNDRARVPEHGMQIAFLLLSFFRFAFRSCCVENFAQLFSSNLGN